MHAVLDRLVHRAVKAVDPDAGWRERMTQLAQATLEVFGEHPSIGAVGASTTTGGEGELAAIELILVAMNDAGLGREDSVRFYGVLSSYVISFAAAQAAAAVAGDVDADPAWIGVHRHSSTRVTRPSRPSATSSRPSATTRSSSPGCRSSWTRSRHGPQRRPTEQGTRRRRVTEHVDRRVCVCPAFGNPDRQVPLPTATRRGPLARWQGDPTSKRRREVYRSIALMISGRSRDALMTASTEPTSTAR